MNSAIHRWLTLPLVLFVGLSGRAQEIGFTAAVDRNSIAAGEYVKLTVTLTNSQEGFEAPSFGGLVVVQGPFESSSFNYVNGRMSSSVGRTWMLTATAPGKYTIGAAKARVGGGIIQTEPIVIEVSKGAARPNAPDAAQGQARDPNLFATISLSKNKAYVGEQVVATYMLYSRYANIELSKYDLPKMDGFWAEEIDLGDTNWEDQLQTVNGLQYRVAVLKRQVLFPQRSGKLRIAPVELSCVVNRSFFNRGSAVNTRSNAVELTAMALPPGPPAAFNGAVGELEMVVKTDRTEVKANEAIELTITYAGRGNLKLIEAPKLNFPSDLEAYDPKVTDKISVNASGMSGSRSFQYLLIPRHEGEFPLEPITFSYFDTRNGGYRTIQAEPVTFRIAPGDGGPVSAIQRPSKTDVEMLGKDIRYIRTGDLQLRTAGKHLFGSIPWFAGMGAPALAFVIFLGWRRKQERDHSDVTGSRRKQADRVARKRLSEAEQALRSSDRNAFYDALGKALHGYLADKFGLGPAQITDVIVRERFAAFTNGEVVAKDYLGLTTACDMARFAPVEDRPKQQIFDEAVALIGRIEQLVRA
ncbi:MAG TPA: BatD family protein [Flavobacteriales bacterium]|nr:BatD family protein [Flavobacteriales bacterium]